MNIGDYGHAWTEDIDSSGWNKVKIIDRCEGPLRDESYIRVEIVTGPLMGYCMWIPEHDIK